ncbi:MAG: ATP-binding cassette domain-containing protein, partial [Rhodothermales bacterium]|nr:ATP-binding cassette domain-containing protein [Rhodothermales bacterium]
MIPNSPVLPLSDEDRADDEFFETLVQAVSRGPLQEGDDVRPPSIESPRVLRAESLVKRYKKRAVVKAVELEVTQGEVVGLLGPNGAGKTTTFYMIVGLLSPDGGDVYLDDRRITGMPMYERARRGIGYLAQEASIFSRLSVEDNLHAVLEYQPITKAER